MLRHIQEHIHGEHTVAQVHIVALHRGTVYKEVVQAGAVVKSGKINLVVFQGDHAHSGLRNHFELNGLNVLKAVFREQAGILLPIVLHRLKHEGGAGDLADDAVGAGGGGILAALLVRGVFVPLLVHNVQLGIGQQVLQRAGRGALQLHP